MVSSQNESTPALDGAPLLASAAALVGRTAGGADGRRAIAAAPAPKPDQVVAEVTGKVTLKEVDDKWEEFDAAERAKVTQTLYQNRRNMLDQLIGDILIEEAAKAAGMSADAYCRGFRPARQAGHEADMAQFYDDIKDQAQGRSFEDLRGPMKQRIEDERAQQARAQLVEDLEKKAARQDHARPAALHRRGCARTIRCAAARRAPMTIIEFSDYQCPFCARVNPTLAKVRETYGDKVKIVFKDFPLPNHPQAPKAAEAAHCAAEQGKYWEMHDAMFANQRASRCRRSSNPPPHWVSTAQVQSVPRLRPVRRDSRGGSGARRQARRQLHADALHQRPPRDRRATIRGLQGRHRRRTSSDLREVTSCRELLIPDGKMPGCRPSSLVSLAALRF